MLTHLPASRSSSIRPAAFKRLLTDYRLFSEAARKGIDSTQALVIATEKWRSDTPASGNLAFDIARRQRNEAGSLLQQAREAQKQLYRLLGRDLPR